MIRILIIAALMVGCGIDHNVKGGTKNHAEVTLEIITSCDRTAIKICKTVPKPDKLECVKYACDVLGMSDENIGDILDAIGGDDEGI